MRSIIFGTLFILAFFTEWTHSEQTPCLKNDRACSATMSNLFIKNLIDNGMPDHNINKMEPLRLDSFQSEVLKDVINHFSNIVVSGMKNTELTYHHMKHEESSVEMKLKFNFTVTADHFTEIKNVPKKFTGVVTIGIISDVHTQFPYELSPDDKGEKYFTLLQETANCETMDSHVSVDNTLLETMRADPDVSPELNRYMNDKKMLDDRQACILVKAVVAKFFENMRLASKIKPANYYISDL